MHGYISAIIEECSIGAIEAIEAKQPDNNFSGNELEGSFFPCSSAWTLC